MSDRATLLTLAERCEAATGADAELELAIAEWCFAAGGVAGVTYDPALWMVRHNGEFTTSLDAAASLVPEGFSTVVRHYAGGPVTVEVDRGMVGEAAVARSEPRARTAAALRARAAMMEDEA